MSIVCFLTSLSSFSIFFNKKNNTKYISEEDLVLFFTVNLYSYNLFVE